MDNKNKMLDFMLLPKSVFSRLTDKKLWLFLSILFIGMVDMGFPLLDRRLAIFTGKSSGVLFYNEGLTLLFVLLIGLIDVVFFSIPLFDIFKLMKKEGELFNNSSLTRFVKAYALAHVLTLPLNAIFYWLINDAETVKSYPVIIIIIAMAYSLFIMPAWFSGIISRGANVIFDFEERFKPLAFTLIFTWNFILGNYALTYIIEKWFIWFYK